ncbi:hypothetical protein PoB_000821000 [Plakobranchus ocellatus]|uniref:Uncharacterized protein n=1 Tax=Plakobranchus ocellatus TaxID=259542 RepID=A0AAV3YG48_9GAST|nr:hypothetical protein PoB_000821000 [Plakobranchus ocellatus]
MPLFVSLAQPPHACFLLRSGQSNDVITVMTTERVPHARSAQSIEHDKVSKVMLSLPPTPLRQSTPTLRLSTSVKKSSEVAEFKLHSYNISNLTSTITTTKATTTSTTIAPKTTGTDSSGTGANTIGQEQLTKEFYRSYDPSTGLHTAAVLGSILVWLVLYVIYRTKVRRCLLKVKRRFEENRSLSSSSLNTNNNTNWNNKNNNGIEERHILGDEDLYACTSDGGQGSSGKKPSQQQDFSDTVSNSGTNTGTNPTMVRSAFINPSIVIETSPTDSLPLSPGAYNTTSPNGCLAQACSGRMRDNDEPCCYGDGQDGTVFTFPCLDRGCQDQLDQHCYDDQIPRTATSPCQEILCLKQKNLRDRCEDHHHRHCHHHHHQDEMYLQTCPQQLPKSILDIPSATARWVQNVPMAMRSFQDLSGNTGGFGGLGFGGLYPLGPMGPVYKPCSCPMVCPLEPQQPLQPLQQNTWNNNSMPVLPHTASHGLPGGDGTFDIRMWEGSPNAMDVLRRRNENAYNIMDILNMKRKKIKRRKERRKKSYCEGSSPYARRSSNRDNTLMKNDIYLDQRRRHTMCVADVERVHTNTNDEQDPKASMSVKGKVPSNLTISLPNPSNPTHKENSISRCIADLSNRHSPVPLPVTPTVTIQNSCGPSYHHRRHTSIASVSSSSSDLMVLPVPLPVASSQPVTPPPRVPSPRLMASPHRIPSSPSRLSLSATRGKTSASSRVPSPHLLHPASEAGSKGKRRSRSTSPGPNRSCRSTPCLKEPEAEEAALISPSSSHGSRENQDSSRVCSSSLSHRRDSAFVHGRCSFKLTRPRKSSSSSSKQSGSEKNYTLPRSGSGLSGTSRPRGCSGQRFHCSPSEGHLPSIASQGASPVPDRPDQSFFHPGIYCQRRCLSDLHSQINTDLSPSSPVHFDQGSCSLSPTSSLPSSKHRCSQLQHQRSISATEMMTSSSRPGRDEGGASPTWSNPSTRTSQGGGASSYSHSPSPHLLQVPDIPPAMRPITPDNTVNIYNNNKNYNSRRQQENQTRFQLHHCPEQYHSNYGISNITLPTSMGHSVLSESNLAYYKSQLFFDDGSNDTVEKLGADTLPGRRNSTFSYSTGKMNPSLCDGTRGDSGTGQCSSNTITTLRPSSSFGSSSSYGSSLHPHHHHPSHHHHSCCHHRQQNPVSFEQEQNCQPESDPLSPLSPLAAPSCSSPKGHRPGQNSMSLLSPIDNRNVKLCAERLTASAQNVNSSNLNTVSTSQQNINTPLSSSHVMETKL